jgi:hypothetical protein
MGEFAQGAEGLDQALAAFDAAYGDDRDERYYALRQVLLVYAASLGVQRHAAPPIVGLTIAKTLW